MSEDSLPSLAQLLRDGMARQKYKYYRDLSRDLSQENSISSEHVRCFLTGDRVPTDAVLKNLCELLKIKYNVAHELAKKARRRQEELAEVMKDPRFTKLVDLWLYDPHFSKCAELWEDRRFALVVQLYGMMAQEEREALLQRAVALRKLKSHAAVA